MQRIFEKIRESAGLEISQYAFDKILRAMATDSYGWRIVDISDQPFNLVAETLKQMENTGYLKFVGSRIDLTRNGKNLLRQRGIYPKADFRCTHCKGTGYDVSTYEEMIAKFNETLEKLPRPESIQNRWIMTPESIFRRAMLMVQKGNSAGKEIVILKDADLLSLALALTRLPDKITVLEDNREMADYLFNLSHTARLPIEVHEYDLKDAIPKKFFGKYDVFMADPPEGYESLMLYLKRGLALLRPGEGQAGFFGLTHTEASLRKWQTLQRELLLMNDIVITDILYEFTEYENENFQPDKIQADVPIFQQKPTVPWYKSCVYRLETLEEFEPLSEPIEIHDDLMNEEQLAYSKKTEIKEET
ncbi:hypothetical protein BMS3Abin05_00918 [bacterium BMS3Abin05]|nr:hypothetical protein BMS3Abin05_00918 [bacterium BMS3Abin05]GBE26877.1 hypothetical protein BMS3Bbin03_00797 [bacterium BMS3Bbin03]